MAGKKPGCKFAIRFGLCLLTCVLAESTAHARSAINFRLICGRLIAIPVRVNGVGPFDFLLDTGTNTTIITPEIARRLNLRTTDQVSLITPSGAADVPRAVLDSLTLGPKSVERLEVIYDSLQGVRSADAKILGVLGQNFLSQFNYLLDYRKRQMVFEEHGDLENLSRGMRLRVEREEGKLIVHTQATTAIKETLRLVLDSGASGLVLFAPRFASLAASEHEAGFLTLMDAARMPALRGRLRSLEVGGELLVDVPAALIHECPAFDRRSEDGLLPTSLFQAIFFQNDKDIVVLNPRGL